MTDWLVERKSSNADWWIILHRCLTEKDAITICEVEKRSIDNSLGKEQLFFRVRNEKRVQNSPSTL